MNVSSTIIIINKAHVATVASALGQFFVRIHSSIHDNLKRKPTKIPFVKIIIYKNTTL